MMNEETESMPWARMFFLSQQQDRDLWRLTLKGKLSVEDHPSKRQRSEELIQECPTRATISYWPDSPEAYQLLMPRQILAAGGDATNCTESPQEVVERRIEVLKSANQSEDSWRNIVDGRDPNNFCSKSEIFEVRQ